MRINYLYLTKRRIKVFFSNMDRKKRHPYRGLAIFTLAAAGMISITNHVMEFVKDKAKCMMMHVKEMKK